MSPAPVRVRVSVSSVDEGVFERSADVVGGQAGDRRHHVTRKLADTQRPPVLTSPPVVLGPENTHEHGQTRRYEQKRKAIQGDVG